MKSKSASIYWPWVRARKCNKVEADNYNIIFIWPDGWTQWTLTLTYILTNPVLGLLIAGVDWFQIRYDLWITNRSRNGSLNVGAKQSKINLRIIQSTVNENRQIVAHNPDILAVFVKLEVIDKSKQDRVSLDHLHVVKVVGLSSVPTAHAFQLHLRSEENSVQCHVWGRRLASLPSWSDRCESIGWCCASCPRRLIA